MKNLYYSFIIFILSVSAANVYGYQNKCQIHYASGKSPIILNKSIDSVTQELCFDNFVVAYNNSTKSALWSAEHLTIDSVKGADYIPRINSFHEEQMLLPNYRTTLKDYAGSSYDRGHLTPAGDEPTIKSQFQSFSLSNMIPQNPGLNRGIWAQYEEKVRSFVMPKSDVYIITGPVFGKLFKPIGNNVQVPDQVFKIFYSPIQKKTVVFLAKNDSSKTTSFVTLFELEAKTGINFLPFLTSQQKNKKDVIQGLNNIK